MATAPIQKIYVNRIVNGLLQSQDKMRAGIDGSRNINNNNPVLALLYEAILNAERLTLEEWIDIYYGLKKVHALKPHIDLIINLKKKAAQKDNRPAQSAN